MGEFLENQLSDYFECGEDDFDDEEETFNCAKCGCELGQFEGLFKTNRFGTYEKFCINCF